MRRKRENSLRIFGLGECGMEAVAMKRVHGVFQPSVDDIRQKATRCGFRHL